MKNIGSIVRLLEKYSESFQARTHNKSRNVYLDIR